MGYELGADGCGDKSRRDGARLRFPLDPRALWVRH